MPRMGNLPFQKSCFAHIALLGFQRAGGKLRRFSSRHLLYIVFGLFQAKEEVFSRKAISKAPCGTYDFHNELILFPLRENAREFI